MILLTGGFMKREEGRLTGVKGPRAAAARAKNREYARESVARRLLREEELRQLSLILNEDEVKKRLGLTQADVDKLREIVQNPGRNAMAQLGAIRTMLQYTVSQPKQEFSGDIGIQVIVNTLRKLPPAVDVTPDELEP